MAKHVFLLETELQTFSALQIVQLEKLSNPVFIVLNRRIEQYLQKKGYTVQYASKRAAGWLKRLYMLETLRRVISAHMSMDTILYTARLDIFYVNVVIGALVSKYPLMVVRIIPDGALNFMSEDVSESWPVKTKSWMKKCGYGVIGGLRPYPIKGEKIGVDTDIVDKVYALKGVQSPYDAEKVEYLTFLSAEVVDGAQKKALVVGQPLISHNQNLKNEQGTVKQLSCEIYNYCKDFGIDQVDYAGHPRDPHKCLSEKSYNEVFHDNLCLEEYLQKNSYDLIISCSSTVLVNAKLMFGDKIQCVSIGMEILPFNQEQMIQHMNAFSSVGVKLLAFHSTLRV